jgi:hypothetical protein
MHSSAFIILGRHWHYRPFAGLFFWRLFGLWLFFGFDWALFRGSVSGHRLHVKHPLLANGGGALNIGTYASNTLEQASFLGFDTRRPGLSLGRSHIIIITSLSYPRGNSLGYRTFDTLASCKADPAGSGWTCLIEVGPTLAMLPSSSILRQTPHITLDVQDLETLVSSCVLGPAQLGLIDGVFTFRNPFPSCTYPLFIFQPYINKLGLALQHSLWRIMVFWRVASRRLLGMFCTSPLVRFFNDFGVGFLFEAGQQTWREDQNTQILTMIRHGWDMNWTGGWLVVWNIVHLAIPAHHTHTHTRKQRKT